MNCVVTSPPYWGLRDYGVAGQLGLEPTPDEYVADLVAVFREVWRALRDDGTVWLNLGDTYKHKSLIGIPWLAALALKADGWFLRSDLVWEKPNAMPESVTDRFTRAHEYLFFFTKSPKYQFDLQAVREPSVTPAGTAGKWNGNRDFGLPGGQTRFAKPNLGGSIDGFRNKRSVWSVATQPFPGAHFACFPQKLVEPCILAGCPLGGIVLDPFVGSGTTVLVAERLGRRGIGLELKSDYLKLAQDRVAAGK